MSDAEWQTDVMNSKWVVPYKHYAAYDKHPPRIVAWFDDHDDAVEFAATMDIYDTPYEVCAAVRGMVDSTEGYVERLHKRMREINYEYEAVCKEVRARALKLVRKLASQAGGREIVPEHNLEIDIDHEDETVTLRGTVGWASTPDPLEYVLPTCYAFEDDPAKREALLEAIVQRKESRVDRFTNNRMLQYLELREEFKDKDLTKLDPLAM